MATDEKNATEIKASEAAQKRADELGVDLATVEPTGAQGQIKVEDVEKAASEQPQSSTDGPDAPAEAASDTDEEDDRMIRVKINPDLRGTWFTGPDGINYKEGQPVSERYFDAVLANARDREGDKVFKKGGAA